MRLKLERVDTHYARRLTSMAYLTKSPANALIIDRYLGRRRLTRIVRLFGKKYSGILKTYTECVAFVKGVEAVLNYMLKAKDMKSIEAALNHMLETEESEAPLEPVGSPLRSIGAGSVCRSLGPRQ